MKNKDEVQLIVDGRRLDGRRPDELRKITMKVGVLTRAAGSAYIEWGNNKILVGVQGPRALHPKYLRDPTKAVLRCIYNMAPFSVDERKKPGPDRRSMEISKVITEALSYVVLLEKFPNTGIDVFIEVLQADAGTRCAAITAASLALADAGIPMRDLVAACAAGKVQGQIVLDIMKEEDNYGEADLPVAIAPRKKEIVLMQMDGNLTREEFKKAYELAIKGALQIYEMQKKALLESMKVEIEE
ncbi:MAG: exosome complex exonuclease Rrp41 [Candidatus Altiarchaeales archaeon]|nr:MAG: exosome complex exonuclease Rrp41 [Candidatus Altiarchaeales archaeon]